MKRGRLGSQKKTVYGRRHGKGKKEGVLWSSSAIDEKGRSELKVFLNQANESKTP